MNYLLPVFGLDVTIKIPIQTRKPERIRIKVRHWRKPYTYYTDRFNVLDGIASFFVKIPKAPKKVFIVGRKSIKWNRKRAYRRKSFPKYFLC